MNKVIIVATLILILGASVFFLISLKSDLQEPSNTTQTATPSQAPSPIQEEVSMDMFVESVEGRVGFMNARILKVNEGHVVITIYVTDETEIIGGDEVTPDNLELLELGTPIRIIGTPSEGGFLATKLEIDPLDHSPIPYEPEI